MKIRFVCFNIFLLTCLIMLGSILQTHSSLANIDSQTTDSYEEIEDSSDSIVPYVLSFMPALFVAEVLKSITLIEKKSQFLSTVSQLLCSNRIALPPPALS